MSCLTIEQIYLYLERELSPDENRKIEQHIASCPKCNNALEERRLLVQAAESLPLWQTPPDFTQKVMARIFPAKVLSFAWLKIAAVGLFSTVLALLAYVLATGQNLSALLLSFNHSLWNSVRNFVPLSVKLFKLVFICIRVVDQFIGYLLKGFSWLTALTSPQLQLIMAAVTIILITFFIYGLKRKILSGEKT